METKANVTAQNESRVTSAKSRSSAESSDKTNIYVPPDGTSEPVSTNDTETVVRRYVEHTGLASDHINSFNELLDGDLNDVFERTYQYNERTIAYDLKKAKKTKDIATVRIIPRYSNIIVHPPRMVVRESGMKMSLTPSFACMNNRYYVAPFTGDFHIRLIATKADGTELIREDDIKNVEITGFPILLKSNKCPLSTMTPEVQIATCEDPLNPGGYFLLGSDWINKHMETLQFNGLRIFNSDHEGIATRAEMLSKMDNTNGNSAQFIIQYMYNEDLLVKIDHKPFRNFFFPFYTIFRLLGVETHKEMMDSIVFEYDSPISQYIQVKMARSFRSKYKGSFPDSSSMITLNDLREYVITYMGTDFNYAGQEVFEKNKNVFFADLYKYIDLYFMPHIGTSASARLEKCRALGLYIRMLFLVECGVYPETDRDSEVSKRNERSGSRMVKMLKTYINSTIARPILDAYEHALKNMSFEDINLREVHNSACDSDRLKKINIRLITGGTKKAIKTGQRGKTIVNRLISQQATGGFLNRVSGLREIVSDPTTASSKASEREHKMRELHPTSFGYKDPVQTQESENIGRNKQMSITCSISSHSNISVLLDTLEAEYKSGLIIRTPSPAEKTRLTRVAINWSGISLGWTDQPYLLVDKYRALRRRGEIDRNVSIVWNIQLQMVSFYCDADRLIRPMCIVQNNYGDSYTSQFCKNAGDLSDFVQWSLLRKHHIRALNAGTITINDLISQGIIEMVDAEEQALETIIAHSPEFLEKNARNHMIRYTHMEMPSAIYGLSALVGNNFNLNNGVRTAYASNHCRQATCEHSSNWRYRKDKGISLQMYTEISPVKTIANHMTISSGVVFRVIVMCHPYDQEDSQGMSTQLAESGKVTTEYLERMSNALGNDEEFKVPTMGNSRRKITADFSSIDATNALPVKNSMLYKGSAAIPKIHRSVDKKTGETVYDDRTSIYPNMEPAMMFKAQEFRNEDDIQVREINMIKTRNPVLGTKFSSRHGQKGVIGNLIPPNDMPFDSSGGIPDLIINPHSFPSRITIAQWIEAKLAEMHGYKCSSINTTVHSPIDIDDIIAQLKEMGLHEDGTSQMFNQSTGIAISTRIFSGLIYYQNVQKNTQDKRYVVESGPTDIITRQPLEGKSVDGGLRIGEMERDVLIAIGATMFTMEKHYYHSNQETIYVCEKCGTVPTVNVRSGVNCFMCGDSAQVYAIDTTWASWVFLEELRTLNVQIRLLLQDHVYYKYADAPAIENMIGVIEKSEITDIPGDASGGSNNADDESAEHPIDESLPWDEL
jgi:DNA-directed RNA polymerase II subunit RPB2